MNGIIVEGETATDLGVTMPKEKDLYEQICRLVDLGTLQNILIDFPLVNLTEPERRQLLALERVVRHAVNEQFRQLGLW